MTLAEFEHTLNGWWVQRQDREPDSEWKYMATETLWTGLVKHDIDVGAAVTVLMEGATFFGGTANYRLVKAETEGE